MARPVLVVVDNENAQGLEGDEVPLGAGGLEPDQDLTAARANKQVTECAALPPGQVFVLAETTAKTTAAAAVPCTDHAKEK